MSRRVLSLVVAGLCLTVTPAVAERAPNGAATTTASHVALAAPMCAARLLPVVRPLTGAAAASCGTTAPTPTPPTPAQALCGPTVAGLNDECPDWASAPLPDVTIADRTNTGIIQSAIPGDGIDATQPTVLRPGGATLYSVGSCMGGPCGPVGGVYGEWADADGVSTGGPPPGDHGIVTAAYDAYSGALEWTRTYDSGSQYESATSVVATRQSVFTLAEHTDDSFWPTGKYESHLLAYRHDGQLLWRVKIPGEIAASNALSGAGNSVYVAGTHVRSVSTGQCQIDATITAFDTTSGRKQWQTTLPGTAGKCQGTSGAPTGSMYGSMVASSGQMVYMTAVRLGSDWTGRAIELAGFDARTGRKVFQTEYALATPKTTVLSAVTGSSSCQLGNAAPLLLSADGRSAFVDDFRTCPDQTGAFITSGLTLAFNARSGALRWHAIDTGGAANDDVPWVDHPMTLTPDGQELVVSGLSGTGSGASVDDGFVTTAYRVTSGKQLWTTRYAYPGHEHQTLCVWCGPSLAHTANAIVVSGYTNGGYDQGIAYAQHPQNATVGYDFKTGRQLWVALDQPWDRASTIIIGADLVANPRTRAVYAITGSTKLEDNLGIRVLGYHATN